ncbi:hypothetical protein HY837_00890 [archaeon]|nr:hypothetical protein [archaeon]
MDAKTREILMKYSDLCKEYGPYSFAASNYLLNTDLTKEMEQFTKVYRCLSRVKVEHYGIGDLREIEDQDLYEKDASYIDEVIERLKGPHNG